MRTKTFALWTPEEDQLLVSHYADMPLADLQQMLPRHNLNAIQQRAAHLQVARRWNQGRVRKQALGSVLTGAASSTDIGWLAGFVDGEGTLQIRRHSRHLDGSRHYFQPLVAVGNTDLSAIGKAHGLMGGAVTNPVKTGQRTKDIYYVRLSSVVRVKPLLETLLPHLTVKAERARLLIEYCNLRQSRSSRAEYGVEEMELYAAFYKGSSRHANAELSSSHDFSEEGAG